MNGIRFFDVVFALSGLVLLSPFLLLISLLIKLSSTGPVLFMQNRVGKDEKDFNVFKFRSMVINANLKGLLTVGGKDERITRIGFYLRKFKLDELPQLINVLKGEMSMVGPRPEVRKYVNLYTDEQKKTLQVLPGITDYASLNYRNENELLALSSNPEEYYIKEIMPRKVELNFIYIKNRNLKEYFLIIAKTLISSVRGN